MEKPHSKLTADPTQTEAVSLLDVNEKLHDLAPQLKERRPEDVASALSLVEQYTKLVIENEFNADEAFQELQKQLPDAKLEMVKLEVGGKTVDELIAEMKERNIKIDDHAMALLMNPKFITEEAKKQVCLVKILIKDFNMDKASNDEILNKAKQLGLRLCKPEEAIYYRLYLKNQGRGERIFVQMEKVNDYEDKPREFVLYNYGRLELGAALGQPDSHPVDQLQYLFCLNPDHAFPI